MAPPPLRRCSFSLDEKRRVLEHLRASGHVRETIAHFYPTLPPGSYDARRRLVLGWRRNAREILAGASTRQGASRKRMRRPRTQRPSPPIPRGLEGEIHDHDEPFLSENEQEMADFDPIEVRNSNRSSQMPQSDEEPDDAMRQNTQEQIQEGGGIQGLIATAVDQSTKRQELRGSQQTQLQPQLLDDKQEGAEDADIETGTGAGARTSDEETEAAGVNKAKRSSFSLDEKRRVLEHLAASKSVRETIEKFYPELPPEEFKNATPNNLALAAMPRADRGRLRGRQGQCEEEDAASRDRLPARRSTQTHCGAPDRLLTSANKSALQKKGDRVLRPAPPVGTSLLAERQVDAIVFSALGLPPTTQSPLVQPPPAKSSGAETAAGVQPGPTMRPLQQGEATFAIRRR